MADGFYQKGMQHWAQGDVAWKASGGSAIRALLMDHADDVPVLATDEFVSALTAAGIEERTGNLTLVDAAADGICDLNDFVFSAAAGDPCESLNFYKFVTADADSPLLLYIDAATGLPVTLNGGDVNVTVNASGLCKI